MTCLKEILEFGEKYNDVFGAEKIKEEILADKDIEPRFSIFSTPSEHANRGVSLKVAGIENPTVADMNFRPYKAIYRARTNDYVSEL
jgi:hypothetical protein